jgi:hypothetical protein
MEEILILVAAVPPEISALMLHKADHQASLETKEGNYEN